jgi:hypothetical protein
VLAFIRHALGWNRASYFLMSAFAATILLIMVVSWPFVEAYVATADPRILFWKQLDWLLSSIFALMSLVIMARPHLQRDWGIVLVGLVGGLVIESWGTQTELWAYYPFERPPLWIIPAWPIASLSIDRLYRLLSSILPHARPWLISGAYWLAFGGSYMIMLGYHRAGLLSRIMGHHPCLLDILQHRPYLAALARSLRRVALEL